MNANNDIPQAAAAAAAALPALPADETNHVASSSFLARVLSYGDPGRMKLTQKENENALAIQEMVEGLPDLDNLSDLMYAQLAIICKDRVEDAVNRCYGMQEFRHEYNLVDNLEQGSRYLRWGIQQLPLHFCPLDAIRKKGSMFL
jgi:hypothetical protein